jgi:hypothetical protein
MSTSTNDTGTALALDISFDDVSLHVQLADGRSVSAPIEWYPRLFHGTNEERSRWELIGNGVGIHWPDLDEDISIEGLLAGRTSAESQRSLQRWLDQRVKSRRQ